MIIYKWKKTKHCGSRSWLSAFAVFLCLMLLTAGLTGCGTPETDDAQSPEFQSVKTWGGCDGGEDDQYIKADMTFDKDIAIADGASEDVKVTIGGDRVKNRDIDLKVKDGKTLEVTIPVDKVTTGVLKITPANGDNYSKITDKTGKYAVKTFKIDKLVPSGVELSNIQATEGGLSADVTAVANHRSIVWIKLTADGKDLKPDGQGTDILNNAIAVHEHDFLWATEESTAADIAEAINKYFGGRLSASSSGNTVSVEPESDAVSGVLGMEVYTY